MPDAMVTARMSQSKKEAGNEVLRSLGYSASQAINELYDRVIESRAWPFQDEPSAEVDARKLSGALAFVDSIARVDASEYVEMSKDEAKRGRLMAKSRATEADFA